MREQQRGNAMSPIRALVMNSQVNVATLAESAEPGQTMSAETGGGRPLVTATEEIPFGFKIALVDIPKEGTITKYGQPIGKASSLISQGDLVHVHNVRGARGRGDLENGGD